MTKLTKSKYIPYLVATAFLMNVMLPFFAVYNISQAVDQFESSALNTPLSDDKVLLCTGNGFKWVSLKDLLEGGEEPIKHHTQYDCALCYVSAFNLNDFIPNNDFTFTFNQSFRYSPYFFLNDINIQEYSLHSIQARAPPYLA